ncbi:DUF2332 family protein [Curtobacterium flaccumfaciens]|nr:DUF2332 family protein [Curtobacterium flaccumfaciens]
MRTLDRYRAYADRIESVSPSYAAWARSVDASLVALLDEVPEQQRQPELVFAAARRLGADPADPVRCARSDWRHDPPWSRPSPPPRCRPTTAAPRPGRPAVRSARRARRAPPRPRRRGRRGGAVLRPDRVTLDYRLGGAGDSTGVPDRAPLRTSRPTATGRDVRAGARTETVRMHTAVGVPAVRLRADASGAVPAPATTPIGIAARVVLDPNPIDLAEPDAFDRLVEAVPPEATDRTALMREAARATLAAPPVRLRGTLPGDLDRVLDTLPDGVEPVVLTTGTLVYVPGSDRQRFVDRVRDRGVHWIALERTGILSGVAATLPADVDAADPDAFATASLDGAAMAVSDPFGVRMRWIRDPNL